MSGYIRPNIFTIEPGQPFLPTLVKALCDGRLIAGFKFDGEPLTLAAVTIYVPTQRAARELRSVFLDYLGKTSVLLPRIRALGEFDEDAALFESDAQNYIKALPPIDPLERQLMLGRLIAGWTKHLADHLRHYFDGEEFTTPVSTADAFWMARDLAELLDQLQTEDLSFDDIEAAAEAETSDWWQVTLSFLNIIKSEWPKILSQRRRVDPAVHRNMMLRGEAARLASNQPTSPVIVAGSTGTIPATADLIATIAKLPAGAVVLPGYDLTMSEQTRTILGEPDDLASTIGHPQYGMHQLVLKMVAPGLIDVLGKPLDDALASRKRWVAAALEPASQTQNWNEIRGGLRGNAFDNVAILVATSEREEASGIAAAMREAIADPKATTALVTPDRMLARRVVTELARYGIQANDSGGSPFELSVHGTLLSFTLKNAFDTQKDAASLLALLKNKLIQIGVDRKTHEDSLVWLEMLILRGGVDRLDIANFSAFADRQFAAWEQKDYKPEWYRHIMPEQVDRARVMAERVQAAFAPLCAIAACESDVPLARALEATILTLEALCADEHGSHRALYDGETGTMLRGVLSQMLASDTDLTFEPNQWPSILGAITSNMQIKPKMGGHPRVSILGALEARLQSVDLLVLGGLNEGTWPRQTTNDAFLTRGMKAQMAMQPPERRIGLSAHDFQMGMGQPKVLLTRAVRVDDAPAVASRWVQRLETLAGAEAVKNMRLKGTRFVEIARALEKPKDIAFVGRPNPNPPLKARPTHFSVTEIERLRRDPYAIYAKKILGLYPIEPFVRDPDAAMRGTLIHKILELATKADIDYAGENAQTMLSQIANDVFDKEQLPEEIALLWRARFDAAIPKIAEWERDRQNLDVRRFAELKSKKIAIDETSVTLSGRADRLDCNTDGTVDIIDFKTGSPPSGKQVRALLSPQLPLEAALLRRGGFTEFQKADVGQMLYVQLGNAGKFDAKDIAKDKGNEVIETNVLAQRAWEKLIDIMEYYGDVNTGYLSRAMPKLEREYGDDYDHLARVMEWSSGVDGVDGDGDAS